MASTLTGRETIAVVALQDIKSFLRDQDLDPDGEIAREFEDISDDGKVAGGALYMILGQETTDRYERWREERLIKGDLEYVKSAHQHVRGVAKMRPIMDNPTHQGQHVTVRVTVHTAKPQ